MTLAPQESRTIAIHYRPTAPGLQSATLVILSNSLVSSRAQVLLFGLGLAPVLRLSNDALIFAIQPAGGASEERAPGATQTLTLTNNGDAPLVIDGLALAGPDFASFHVVTDTGE